MRRLLALIFSLVIFCSCEKEPHWRQETLNHELLISFPDTYTGTGIYQGREGNVFSKVRNDSSSVFRYTFCGQQFCAPYGNILNADSVYYIQEWAIIELDESTGLNNGGLFYYSSESGIGKFYWKNEGVYKESLLVEYDPSLYNEVIDVLKTIRRK
ncbi:hypothetical protein D770_19610 [Flammeovirgaceae bacterium 311]|nr:hypothetical protein D770_19610 [Flammeovirgaceae bacterium 311]